MELGHRSLSHWAPSRPDQRALNAREQQYSVEFGDQVVSEVQMELFCETEDVARAVDIFRQVGRTGRADAGWVYISDIEQVIAIADPKQQN